MKKIGKYLLVAIAILLVVLIVAPLLFKKQIVNQIKLMANKQLNATLNFNPDISLNLFSHFPHLSVVIRELTIVGKDDFAGDTLLDIKRLQAVVNLQSIWGKGPYEIRYVALDKPDLRLIVNRAGKANWDIVNNSSSSSATASTPSAFRAALQRYVIREGSMQYADSSLNFYLSMQGLNHEGKGDFTQDVFNLQTQSHISSFTLVYDHIPYLHQVKADVQVNVHVDIPHQSYRFQQGTATLNGLTLLTEGEVRLPDSNQVYMDIHFRTAKTDFKQLLSLIPAIYTRNFAQLKASGTAVLSGDIKGSYQDNRIPAFHVQLQVQDGMFQYPSLPDALSHVQMQIQVNNDDGIVDHTIVNLQQLHLEMNQQPVDAHLLIRYPQSQMLIDGALHGKLDLASISRIYPLQTHTKLSGTLDADVQIKGSLEALQHKQYSQFQAKGYILANQIHYQSADFPQGISISEAQLMFSPQQVILPRLQAIIGKSDIQAQGKLNQFYTYVFGKGPLEADLHVQSQLLDLNALMDSSSRPQADTHSAVKAVVIPRNMQLHITADIAHFVYSNYDLHQVQGKATVADGILHLDQIKANMLGGEVMLSGTYNTQQPDRPQTDMTIEAKEWHIPQLLQTVSIAQAFLPLQQAIQGQFSGKISLSTALTDKLMPVLSSVNSTGRLQIQNLNLAQFVPLQKLAMALGLTQLPSATWPTLGLGFDIDSGYLFVHPFELLVDSVQMKIAGKNGLDKHIDYTIEMTIPRSKLGQASSTLNQLIAKANAAAGTAIQAGDKLHVNVHLTGTILQPTLKLDLTPMTSSVKQTLTTAAQQKLQEEKQKLIQQLMPHDSQNVAQDSAPVKQRIEKTLQKTFQKGIRQLLNKGRDTTR